MTTADKIKTLLHDLLMAFFDFEKENWEIRRDARLLVKETREQTEKQKILDTLHMIDKL